MTKECCDAAVTQNLAGLPYMDVLRLTEDPEGRTGFGVDHTPVLLDPERPEVGLATPLGSLFRRAGCMANKTAPLAQLELIRSKDRLPPGGLPVAVILHNLFRFSDFTSERRHDGLADSVAAFILGQPDVDHPNQGETTVPFATVQINPRNPDDRHECIGQREHVKGFACVYDANPQVVVLPTITDETEGCKDGVLVASRAGGIWDARFSRLPDVYSPRRVYVGIPRTVVEKSAPDLDRHGNLRYDRSGVPKDVRWKAYSEPLARVLMPEDLTRKLSEVMETMTPAMGISL